MPTSQKRRSSQNRSRQRSFSKRISGGLSNAVEKVEDVFKNLGRAVSGVIGGFFAIIVPPSLRQRLKRNQSESAHRAKKIGKRVGEFTEKVETQFSSGASGVGEIIGLLLSIFIPTFIRRRVAAAWKSGMQRLSDLFERLSKRVGKWAERFLPAWLLSFLRRLSSWFGRITSNLSRFFTAWWSSRDFKKLAWSTPAVMMTVPLVGCMTLAVVNSNSSKILHYHRVAFEAAKDGEYERASLLRRKLKQLGYQKTESAAYLAALEMAEQGDFEGALGLMQSISLIPGTQASNQGDQPSEGEQIEDLPENQGFVFGHLWICGALMDQLVTLGSEDLDWDLIDQHAKRVLELEPDNISARYFSIKVDEREGMDVLDRMTQLANEYPQFSMALMANHFSKSEFSAARQNARKFIRYFDSLTKAKKIADFYIGYARAHAILGNQSESDDAIIEGHELFNEEELLQTVAAEVFNRRLATMSESDKNYLLTLKKAHIADRDNMEIANKLAQRWVEDKDATEPIISSLLDTNQLGANVARLAGDLHLANSNSEEAIRRYEDAIEIDPNVGEARNNLAWVLANIPPLDLDRALELVNEAIALKYEDANYFETRGNIFFKLQRWQEAAADLERALNGGLSYDDARRAHETLVIVYEALGEHERAAAHRALAGI